MGGTNWDASAYTMYSSSVASTPREALFKNKTAAAATTAGVTAKDIKIRESRDSAANPNSTPLIIATDVTGSMGILAEQLVKEHLGIIMGEVISRRPITDPHVMGIAIGDGTVDTAPIQATQFEASTIIVEQLTNFYIEGGGGGNGGESYAYAWLFADLKCVCDSQIKRNKKGYLFTIGDESPLTSISSKEIQKFFGEADYPEIKDVSTLLKRVEQNWHVFHLIIKPVPHQTVVADWRKLLGERAIQVQDATALAEIIVSLIQVNEGHNKNEVINSWTGDKSLAVATAVNSLSAQNTGSTGDLATI